MRCAIPLSYFSLTVALLLLSCMRTGHQEKKVQSRGFSTKEMKEAALQFGMAKANIERAVEVRIFVPANVNCTREIPLKPPQNFGWFNPQEDLSQSPETAIKKTLSSLFRVFADPYIAQHENRDYDALPLENVIDSLLGGIWAPQCAGISRTAARIINTYSTDLHATVVETAYLDHTLNIVAFEKGGQRFAVVADFQNGFLFPVKPVSGGFFTREELESLTVGAGSFLWLPKHIQHRKRNLLFSVLPCNFLPDEKERYHEAPKGSPYAFERLSFSFHKHLWFDLGTADIDRFKQELLNKLRNLNS
jgi:hypothetical protein